MAQQIASGTQFCSTTIHQTASLTLAASSFWVTVVPVVPAVIKDPRTYQTRILATKNMAYFITGIVI